MSVFGGYATGRVVDAAEKFIGKMDEGDLASAIDEGEPRMTAQGRALLVEAIFDAFRARGESSEDAVEGAGTTLEALSAGETNAMRALLHYARANTGLLKEAAIALIEREPAAFSELSPRIAGGIAQRLAQP
ncbi:MAG TPA: hypothetical protein VFA29_03870 [Candidatus Baltobacteraceae bacterium]|nr:hypothetical protein [Candidatus Baltobacteraceae bacterium]